VHVGIPIPNILRPTGTEAIRRVALAAEACGYGSVWLGDHVVRPKTGRGVGFADSDMFTGDLYEAFCTAGYVAAITSRVEIGFGVVVLPYRHPLLTAKMVATLDQLSHGRIVLGVGAGYWEEEFEALGVSPRRRGVRTDEYIEAMRAAWSSESPAYQGEFVQFDDLVFRPPPRQERVPIWIGGTSEGALKRAIALGDGWHWHGTVEEMNRRIDRLDELAAAAGRDLSSFVISNRPPVRFAAKPDLTRYADYPENVNPPIVGPPGYLAEQLARFATESRISHLVLDLHMHERWYDDPLDDALAAVERFAAEVLPHLVAL
jgi:probable F420-dependent oxidoreductase